jgi:outer membrane receptor protein involved in Fe transport
MNNKFINKINRRRWLILVSFLAGVHSIYSQTGAQNVTGNIKGKVVDSTTGKPLFGVTFIIRSEKVMVMSDENGNYLADNVSPGEYEAEFILSGYEKMIKKVKIVQGKTLTVDTALYFKTARKVVVRTKADNTSASLLTERKKSINAQDAISSEEIAKAGDSDAASAAKRITGITLMDKFIYIRGLSERYSTVLFNGSYVPSPDPDKKMVPLDIFPSGLLDNMVIMKTWSPDLPGEFGAGTVMINPKDFPTEKEFKISIDLGYHSLTTFRDFQTYEGGSMDWLGFDDGTRALPPEATGDRKIILADILNPDGYTVDEVVDLSKRFPKFSDGITGTGLPAGSINIYFGNTYDVGTAKLGVIASALYKEESKNQEKIYKTYNVQAVEQINYTENESVFSTVLGGLLWNSLQFNDDHQILLTNFYTHQSEDTVARITGYNEDLDSDIDALGMQFIETGLFFSQLVGKHRFPGLNSSEFTWRTSYANASRYEPGTLKSLYAFQPLTLTFRDESPMIFYSDNKDETFEVAPEFKIPFRQWGNLEASAKLGGNFLYRERNSNSRRFVFYNAGGVDATLPRDELFQDSNIASDVMYIKEITGTGDYYVGSHTLYGGYGLLDFPIYSGLKLAGGVRYENSRFGVESYDKFSPGVITSSQIDSDSWLPSAALIFSGIEKLNIRASYSQTKTRPDFKETSPFIFVTIVGGEVLIGNPDLVETTIDSVDLRFEFFPGVGQVLALTGFYKYLEKPVEVIEMPSSSTIITYVNIDSVTIYGIEGEIKVDFGFIADALNIFAVSLNAAYIFSEISASDDLFLTNTSRPLQGQSPYIVNAALHFNTPDKKLEFSVLYNIFGERIVRSGSQDLEDTYEQPHHRLDATFTWNMTEKDSIKAGVKNILDPEIKTTQGENLRSSYREGVSAKVGYTHKF